MLQQFVYATEHLIPYCREIFVVWTMERGGGGDAPNSKTEGMGRQNGNET